MHGVMRDLIARWVALIAMLGLHPSRKPTPPERSHAVAQAFRHFSMAARSWVP